MTYIFSLCYFRCLQELVNTSAQNQSRENKFELTKCVENISVSVHEVEVTVQRLSQALTAQNSKKEELHGELLIIEDEKKHSEDKTTPR